MQLNTHVSAYTVIDTHINVNHVIVIILIQNIIDYITNNTVLILLQHKKKLVPSQERRRLQAEQIRCVKRVEWRRKC